MQNYFKDYIDERDIRILIEQELDVSCSRIYDSVDTISTRICHGDLEDNRFYIATISNFQCIVRILKHGEDLQNITTIDLSSAYIKKLISRIESINPIHASEYRTAYKAHIENKIDKLGETLGIVD